VLEFLASVVLLDGASLSPSIDKQLQSVGWYPLHATLALIVSPFIVVMLSTAADTIFKDGVLKRLLDLGGLANPVSWCPGFVLGFLLNRKGSNRSACWVWPIGLAWLAYAIWDSVRSYDARWYQGCTASENVVNAFFILNARKCGGGESTLAGLFFTLPAISSVAYSIGAWIRLLSRKRLGKRDTSPEATPMRLGQPEP
jgi:hypothetical protein